MSGFKRSNVFDQGRPERPYEERDEPAEVPQRATAAQLATRKIKTAKVRRPAGASSNLTQSANFGAPQQSGFSFGASAPAPSNNSASLFDFGGNSAFGSGATNSFPPAQSSAPSNSFASSSFPAFGASSQSTAFDSQPPSTGFNFTAGGANPFGSSNPASTMNGATPAPAFGGFGQSQSNPFGGLGQGNTTSSVPSSMFGATSASTQASLFSTASSSAPDATSTPAPTSQPFAFGAGSSAQNNTSTPAPTNMFGGFGASAQASTPAQNNVFGGFGASTQNNATASETTAPKPNLFPKFGTTTQVTENTTAAAPAPSLFSFNSSTPKSDNTATTTPATNLLSTSSSAAPSASTPSSASASNPFAKLSSTPSTTPSLFNFAPTAQTPQGQEKAPSTSNNLFGSLKPAESSSSSVADTSKPNLFASLAKPNGTPTASLAGATPGFSIFGASQNHDAASGNTEKAKDRETLKAPQAPKAGLFNGFSTPQPAKPVETEKQQGGLFSAAQPKTSSGIFSQTFQPEKHNSGELFKPRSALPSFTPQSTASNETPKDTTAHQIHKEASNPFSNASSPSAERPNLFNAAKESAPATSALAMPTLTGVATEASKGPELPKIPKVHVPKEWSVPSIAAVQTNGGLYKHVSDLTVQLQALNERYRQQLSSLPLTADWSSVSLWHYQHATEIKKKIDNAKKQRAAAKGVTGTESTLSTKRKVNNESPENRDASPTKRSRASDASSTPTPQPSVPPPKFNPPATSTSNMFAKAISNKPSTSSASTSLFTPKTAEGFSSAPSKPAAPVTAFTPSSSAANGTNQSGVTASSTGFTPTVSGASKTSSNSTGFQPNFGSSSTSEAGGFFTQFTKTAKTYDELAAERKAKAMAEDYDSDEESKEQWSSRYDKKEAERLAAEQKQIAATPTFSVPTSTKSSGTATPTSNPFAGLTKPLTGASTPGLFTPRVASPAPSTGSQSVFDAPGTAQTPSSNIFGHLSSSSSSNHQDDSDDDDGQQASGKSQRDQPTGSVAPITPPKRSSGESETESDETLEETMRRKKQDSRSKGNLLSRMTRDDDDAVESEKENNNSASVFGQTNGTQTPTNKPFQFFDFGAAGSQTAPPKSDTFAGDQTFKPGTPIKFGGAPATEKKDAAPKFMFQPATPSATSSSTTPAKPPPTTFFNFGSSTSGSSLLAPNSGFSGPGSVASSVFSSRAGTPLSEADTSAASAAEDEEEGGKQEQVDFARLTEDELEALDIVFHAEVALAKHAVDKGDGSKTWANIAKGPLWILKDKVTAKCFVRIRIASGATPLNYQILPALQATVTGSSKKQVVATMPKKEGGLNQVYYALKTAEIAEDFASKYNESLPSN